MAAHSQMKSFYKKPTLEADWEEARRFHGHLGPWLALGMKMGAVSLTMLGARPHFGTRVRVWCRLATPVSCLIDGLQWMTGATFGKQNLTAEASDDIRVHVENKDTGASLSISLLPGTAEAMTRWFDEMGDEEASYHVFAQPADKLFEVTRADPTR